MEVSNEMLVRRALAAHLDAAAAEFTPAQALSDDLGLDPLDLVLVALRLEEHVGVEFPIARLEHVQTVGDLDALVTSWRDDAVDLDDDDRPTLPAPASYSPLSFDTASEAFFVQPVPELQPTEWPLDEEDETRELLAQQRRRAYRPWVAFLLAGSAALLAAAWLPLLGR